MGLLPPFSLADDGYDVGWIEETIQKASAHDKYNETGDHLWTSGWLEDLNRGKYLEKWLKTEVTPGILMQDIIVPLCVLYATADELISKSNEVSFTDWIENDKLQKSWIWVLRNGKTYKWYGHFSERMQLMQKIKEGKATVADVLDNVKKMTDFAATGDIVELVSPKDYVIGKLTELSKGTFEGDVIEGVTNLFSLYSVVTAPTPLGIAVFISNFDNYYNNIKSLEDYFSGLTNLRHAYLLYYIGDELFAEDWNGSFDGHEKWQIPDDLPNNQEILKMSLVDMMMFIPSVHNDLPQLTGGWWFEEFPYNLGYPYFGGYSYHHGYDGDTLQTLSALKKCIIDSKPLIRYNEDVSCDTGKEKCFYNEWAKIFCNKDIPTEDNVNDTRIFLSNLGSIFQYYKSLTGTDLLADLKAVKAEFNGLNELKNGPQLKGLKDWDACLEEIRKYFASQISTALRGEDSGAESINNNYSVGRGIGFRFMGDLIKGPAQVGVILERARKGYDRALSDMKLSPMHPDTDYHGGLAFPIDGNWWMQRFTDTSKTQQFALYIPIKVEPARVVYGDFLKSYEGDGKVPALKPKLGMPTTNRKDGVQRFENGWMREGDNGETTVYIKPKKPVTITNLNTSPNGDICFDGMLLKSYEIKYGGNCRINVDAQDGYLIEKVTVTNADNGTIAKEEFIYAQSHYFRLDNIQTNYSIDATFIEDEQYGYPLRITSPHRYEIYPASFILI
jgi:hypothetical protein